MADNSPTAKGLFGSKSSTSKGLFTSSQKEEKKKSLQHEKSYTKML